MPPKKKAPTKKNAVAKKEAADLALPFDFTADAGIGMEGADSDSFAIPFLRILQPLSPQCTEHDAEYIEGAKAGMILNSVTGELVDGKEGITFLPCSFQRRFLQWAPRGSDRGYGGEFLPEDIAAMRIDGRVVELEGRLYVPLEDGTVHEKKCDKMTDTRSHFGIAVTEAGASQVLLPLSSTQIKKSKQLMSMLNSAKVKGPNGLVTPPTWMNAVKMTTVLESNDQGSWFGVKFEAGGFIQSKDLYDAGKAFHEMIAAGEAKANYAADEGDEKPEQF